MAVVELTDPFKCIGTVPKPSEIPAANPDIKIRLDTDKMVGTPVPCSIYPGYSMMLQMRGKGDNYIVLARESVTDFQAMILSTKPKRIAAPSAMHRTMLSPANNKPLVTRNYVPIQPVVMPRFHARPATSAITRTGR